MRRFVVLSPPTNNVQLIKDTGMIAYHFHKKYAYESVVACHCVGEYPYLHSYLSGLKIHCLDQYPDLLNPSHVIDGRVFLSRFGHTIDVLNLYGLAITTFDWIVLYKNVNPKGKIYVKIDGSETNTPVRMSDIHYQILNMCDLVSIESKLLYNILNDNWPLKVEYIPNGYFRLLDDNIYVDFAAKENIILTVGRIGAYPKATEILLKAFGNIHSHIPDWKLVLAGPIEDEFKSFLANFYLEQPSLKSKVLLLGNVADRTHLEAVYRKAKVFCLSSRWEGFPLAGVEALREGCALLLTNFQSAYDLTDDEKYGKIVPIDDIESMQNELVLLCNDEKRLKEICNQGQRFAKANFNWDILVEKIYQKLELD